LQHGCSFEIAFFSDGGGPLIGAILLAHYKPYFSILPKRLGDITAWALSCQDGRDRKRAIVCETALFKPRQKSTVFKDPGKDRAAGTGYLYAFIKHLAVHLTALWWKLPRSQFRSCKLWGPV